MSCEQYRDALTDVAAGGPAPAGLEGHLASCEGCRAELAARRKVLAIAEVEMARLVGAEPSPALAARIRSSIAQSGSARVWPVAWLWPALAASAVLLVAFAVWVARAPSPARVAVEGRPAVTPGESRPAEPVSRTSEAPERTLSSSPQRAVAPSQEGPAAATRGRRPARAVPAAPEVLVPRGETEALVRFAATVYRDRNTPRAFAATGRPSPDLAEPAELVIKPLEIVPLDPAETPGT